MHEEFVILAQPALPANPAERTLDDPSMRQQLEAFDIIRTLDDLHAQAATVAQREHPGQQLSRISAVCPDEAQAQEGVGEALQDQFGAITVLNIGRMDDDRQDEA